MKIQHFGVTFWFNIYDDFNILLESLKDTLKDEFNSFNYNNIDSNLLMPVITSVNNDLRRNVHVTQISAQYNMDDVSFDDLDLFKEKAILLFDTLTKNDIKILYSSVVVNSQLESDDSLKLISNNILNKKIITDDLIESSIKIATKVDDQFYKVINLSNNKEIKITKKVDEKNRPVPIPLISLNGSFVERECVMIDYELNDRYLYDFTKDYNTTEFHLNKMLFLIKENYKNDVNNLIDT